MDFGKGQFHFKEMLPLLKQLVKEPNKSGNQLIKALGNLTWDDLSKMFGDLVSDLTKVSYDGHYLRAKAATEISLEVINPLAKLGAGKKFLVILGVIDEADDFLRKLRKVQRKIDDPAFLNKFDALDDDVKNAFLEDFSGKIDDVKDAFRNNPDLLDTYTKIKKHPELRKDMDFL
jgi:hypothetical protein